MFIMFLIGLLFGAGIITAIYVCFLEKLDAFKIAVVCLLLAMFASQWKLACDDANYQQQYHRLSGGKGDGYK